MPKVNEFSVILKIDLAKGEYLNFSPACHSHLSVIWSVGQTTMRGEALAGRSL
jgi:hypothetical protein